MISYNYYYGYDIMVFGYHFKSQPSENHVLAQLAARHLLFLYIQLSENLKNLRYSNNIVIVMRTKRLFEEEELLEFRKKLLKTRKPLRNVMVLDTLIHTGLRIEEIMKIKIEDIDFINRRIGVIAKRKKALSKKFSRKFKVILETYIQEKKLFPSDFLIGTSSRNIEWIFEKKEIPAPHSFRHHYAIKLLNKTNNLKYVQNQLGHTSIATTADIYLQYWDNDKLDNSLEDL